MPLGQKELWSRKHSRKAAHGGVMPFISFLCFAYFQLSSSIKWLWSLCTECKLIQQHLAVHRRKTKRWLDSCCPWPPRLVRNKFGSSAASLSERQKAVSLNSYPGPCRDNDITVCGRAYIRFSDVMRIRTMQIHNDSCYRIQHFWATVWYMEIRNFHNSHSSSVALYSVNTCCLALL